MVQRDQRLWLIQPDGLNLRKGDKVSYDVVANRGKESAENLKTS